MFLNIMEHIGTNTDENVKQLVPNELEIAFKNERMNMFFEMKEYS